VVGARFQTRPTEPPRFAELARRSLISPAGPSRSQRGRTMSDMAQQPARSTTIPLGPAAWPGWPWGAMPGTLGTTVVSHDAPRSPVGAVGDGGFGGGKRPRCLQACGRPVRAEKFEKKLGSKRTTPAGGAVIGWPRTGGTDRDEARLEAMWRWRCEHQPDRQWRGDVIEAVRTAFIGIGQRRPRSRRRRRLPLGTPHVRQGYLRGCHEIARPDCIYTNAQGEGETIEYPYAVTP